MLEVRAWKETRFSKAQTKPTGEYKTSKHCHYFSSMHWLNKFLQLWIAKACNSQGQLHNHSNVAKILMSKMVPAPSPWTDKHKQPNTFTKLNKPCDKLYIQYTLRKHIGQPLWENPLRGPSCRRSASENCQVAACTRIEICNIHQRVSYPSRSARMFAIFKSQNLRTRWSLQAKFAKCHTTRRQRCGETNMAT